MPLAYGELPRMAASRDPPHAPGRFGVAAATAAEATKLAARRSGADSPHHRLHFRAASSVDVASARDALLRRDGAGLLEASAAAVLGVAASASLRAPAPEGPACCGSALAKDMRGLRAEWERQGRALGRVDDASPRRGYPPGPSPRAQGLSFQSPPDFHAVIQRPLAMPAPVLECKCGEMVPYAAPGHSGFPKLSGLGAIQPHGRREVLELLSRPSEPSAASASHPRAPAKHMDPGARADAAAVAEFLQWSALSEPARQALRQWCAGQLRGRHCMLIVEQSASSDPAVTPDGSSPPNLQGGAALNVLSGFHADARLIGGQDGGWLHEEVFSKSPTQALDDGLLAAAEAIGHLSSGDARLADEQAHLALRRCALRAQQRLTATSSGGKEAYARAVEEYTRVQVWLELLRLQVEGWPRPSDASSLTPAAAARSSGARGRSKERDAREGDTLGQWNDGGVVAELGKDAAAIEAEGQQMSLEALRAQNRAIEDYVLRLLKQRDELKRLAKSAEEKDSYLILGLAGPEASEEDVKKAYRNLARREHPDKAGLANHKRFQAIQAAYTNILKQRKEGGVSCSQADADTLVEPQGPYPAALEAAEHAMKAHEAADRTAACAHRMLRGSEQGTEAQQLPKPRALRALRELTRRGIADLRDAAVQLRALGEACCNVARCVDEAAAEHGERGGPRASSEVGPLRDRAAILEDAGRACGGSAELLEKISEATEGTVAKVEAADAGGKGTRGGGEAASLVKLGLRLLGESLGRNASVARRAADEALTGAMKALELSRSISALGPKKAERKDEADEDAPMAAPDVEEARQGKEGGGDEEGRADAGAGADVEAEAPRPPTPPEATPRDRLNSAARRVKEQHVALRVKNLRFLSDLNEEALRAQAKLRTLLEQGGGALMPEVSVPQKCRLFDLVSQLLDTAVAEATRVASDLTAQPRRALERTMAFASALEHGDEIAVPTDSRTQVLKLAGLVDADLLCQVIDGPFCQRLLAAGAVRSRSAAAAIASRGSARDAATAARLAAEAWDQAVRQCCARTTQVIRKALCSRHPGGSDDDK